LEYTVHNLRLLINEIHKGRGGGIFYNKVAFKRYLKKHGVRVPETYVHILSENQIEQVKDYDEFVLKPVMGSCGQDIYNLKRISEDEYLEIDGRIHPWSFVRGKIALILSIERAGGVLIEETIHHSPKHDRFLNGLKSPPDTRCYMVYGKVVYAKFRIPTKRSEGYGNSGKGAVPLFVSKSGIVEKDNIFRNTATIHKESGKDFEGVEVPFWSEMVGISEKISGLFNLDYHSVDLMVNSRNEILCAEAECIPFLSYYTVPHGVKDLMDRFKAIPIGPA